MLIVSHDRYFINRIARRMLYLTPDGTVSVEGGYDALCERLERDKKREATAQQPVGSKAVSGSQKRETAELRRKTSAQLRLVEQQIARVEEESAAAKDQLSLPETVANFEMIMELSQIVERCDEQLLTLMEEWEELQNVLDNL